VKHIVWRKYIVRSFTIHTFVQGKVRHIGEVVPPLNYQAMKMHPLIKHHAMRIYVGMEVQLHASKPRCYMQVVSFTTRLLYPRGERSRYPLNRRLGGPHNRSGRGDVVKNSLPMPVIEPWSSNFWCSYYSQSYWDRHVQSTQVSHFFGFFNIIYQLHKLYTIE
jgi:hypothetical protein